MRYGTGLYADDPDQCFVCGEFRRRHGGGELCKIPVKDYKRFCEPKWLRNRWLRMCNKFYRDLARDEAHP